MLPSVDQSTAMLDRLIQDEEARFLERSPEAAIYAEKAAKVLPGGVTSSWQISRPQPIWIEEGRGSRVRDVDGNEYVDYHGGYGAMLAGALLFGAMLAGGAAGIFYSGSWGYAKALRDRDLAGL